ncbi:class I SAM-dependent methyltransferase [Bradyrhizobium sp. SYSU BS000235]|uniref:class I SAM-dependent methyltransferase n=1 Tax=Bradyrhizobium sp. SYSU BS000235 TaxID=3411332 RepID=UPI003C75244F
MNAQEKYPHYVSDQREFFDTLITDDWETYKSDEWDYMRRFEVARLLELTSPCTILDVGCGCGFHDVAFAESDIVERVDAIDYSSKSIERAEISYPHPKVKRWVADLRELPADTQYDLVASFQVIEHLDTPEDFLAMCARVCRPGGVVAIATPNVNRLHNLVRLATLKPRILVDPQHFKEYSASDLERMARPFGLRQIGVFGCGLNGLNFVDHWPYQKRCMAGYKYRQIANVFCIILQKI